MSGDYCLPGLRVLLVDDESLVLMLLEDELTEMGCVVAGLASRLNEAMEIARSLAFDVAILDLNLNGQQSFPLTEIIADRGLPFVLATGYDTADLPTALCDRPIIGKPFQKADLVCALRAAISAGA